MINALAISNNVHFIQKLLDELIATNSNIKLVKVSTTNSETMDILNILKIDIIFLDKSLSQDYDKAFLRRYKPSTILLTYKEDSDLISPRSLKAINTIIYNNDFDKRKEKVVQELEYIGYKFKYKGTHYLVDTILQMYISQNNLVDNLQSNIYPIVAAKYNKSIYNVKSSINKATESMYYECDATKLEKYFHFCRDAKPTVKQVVFTVINKI